MTNQLVDAATGKRILAQVHEGMHVYNSHGETIGKVEAVYLGAASAEEMRFGTGPATADVPETPEGPFAEMLAGILAPEEIPAEMVERLRYSGFIRVNVVGFNGADRFVMPDQIDHVSEGGIQLKLPEPPRITD